MKNDNQCQNDGDLERAKEKVWVKYERVKAVSTTVDSVENKWTE